MGSSMNQEAVSIEEKRVFPRMQSECTVLYSIGTSKRWSNATMQDISATGIGIVCDEQLLRNISISVITKPGSNKVIPEITATGKVARCVSLGDNKFFIGCKLTKIRPT